MNKYLSEKINIISLFLIIMVVWIHGFTFEYGIASDGSFYKTQQWFDWKISLFVQSFFSQGINRIAVPMFFIISGYLFFLKFNGTKQEFIYKIKKRFHSLVVPFIFWALFGVVIVFLLQFVPSFKQSSSRSLIINYSLFDFFDSIALHPISGQLWFLRDLIVMVFFCPIFYYAIKYMKILPTLCFFVLWLLGKDVFAIPRNEAIVFFSFGAYLSIHNKGYLLKTFNKKIILLITFSWIIIVGIQTILGYDKDSLLCKVGIVVGLFAFWTLYDLCQKKILSIKLLKTLSCYTFFIYVFHFPLLLFLFKTMFHLFGKTETSSLIIYFLCPTIIIFVSICVAYLLKRLMPKVYSFILGGR